ncbi:MAG TPA: hypothetical protein VJV23_13060 [Candidatus Polarisedimenticolia bacterium]|nr:hypothetical protein [Candidatus Polarisedimenticolia bacterium]
MSPAAVLHLVLAAAAGILPAGPAVQPGMKVDLALPVPLDHDDPSFGWGTIRLESGAPFDPALPTVLVVADGQQFFLRAGRVASIQEETFGPGINVIGVIGRGTSADILARLGEGPEVDWALAMRLFGSRQWIGDIESARRAVAGPAGRVHLYGVSGGALLAHQYLAAHPEGAASAVTAVGPLRALEVELGLRHDRFWDELGEQDPRLRARLTRGLERSPADRAILIRLLQRQHFFVTPGRLPAERASLIEEMARGDAEALARRREAYQVDAVETMLAGPAGAPIRVRIYESIHPLLGSIDLFAGPVHPNAENEYHVALPLVEASRRQGFPPVSASLPAAGQVLAEVLMLAGRHDQTADYRTQIALAARYPNGRLLLLDDDHMLARAEGSGLLRRLVPAFLVHGPGSAAMKALEESIAGHRWRE